MKATEGKDIAVVGTVHIRVAGETRVHNALIVARNGKLELVYTKLHLYDAFKAKESDNVKPGDTVPALVKIGPFTAWVKGPLKEMHWDINVRARALENTVYVAAISECGPVNIGSSKVVNPLGVVTAQAGVTDELFVTGIDHDLVTTTREALPVLANRRFKTPELA